MPRTYTISEAVLEQRRQAARLQSTAGSWRDEETNARIMDKARTAKAEKSKLESGKIAPRSIAKLASNRAQSPQVQSKAALARKRTGSENRSVARHAIANSKNASGDGKPRQPSSKAKTKQGNA